MTTALLVIDAQAALCRGEWAAFEAQAVVERINHVVRAARAAGAAVVWVQHEESGGPMAHGSAGWQLDAALQPLATDLRLRKTTPDAFHHTDLHARLQARGVQHLVLCGFQSEYCVDSTTRGALAHGYPVSLVADGHSTLDNGVLTAAQISAHHTETLSRMDSFGPRVQVVAAADIRIDA